MENILTTDSVFDRLVKILDTNCGYVDEEKAENLAKRLMRSGLIREEKPLIKTNADRIRSMTDEELSSWLNDHADCNNRCEAWNDRCTWSDSTCMEAWLEWLRAEAN